MSFLYSIINLTLLYSIINPKRLKTLLSFCKGIDYWQNNPSITNEDVEISHRIIKAYHSQNNDPRRSMDHSIGRWEKQLQKRHKCINFLKNSEPYALAYFLRTFYRNPGSSGIIAMSNFEFNADRWGLRANSLAVREAFESQKKIKAVEASSSIKLKHLHAPIMAGNPYICKIGDELIHPESLHSLNHVYAIANTANIPLKGKNLFVEIGPGAGVTACHLLKTYINSKIILVEIPEILINSSYVLSKEFPNKKIAFFDEIISIEKAIQDFDILLIPHWFIDNIPNSVVNLFVNTTSLSDMPTSEKIRYLSAIDRCLKPGAYFYNYNYMVTPPTDTLDEDGSGNGLMKVLKDMDVYDQYTTNKYNNLKVLHDGISECFVLEKPAN